MSPVYCYTRFNMPCGRWLFFCFIRFDPRSLWIDWQPFVLTDDLRSSSLGVSDPCCVCDWHCACSYLDSIFDRCMNSWMLFGRRRPLNHSRCRLSSLTVHILPVSRFLDVGRPRTGLQTKVKLVQRRGPDPYIARG